MLLYSLYLRPGPPTLAPRRGEPPFARAYPHKTSPHQIHNISHLFRASWSMSEHHGGRGYTRMLTPLAPGASLAAGNRGGESRWKTLVTQQYPTR